MNSINVSDLQEEQALALQELADAFRHNNYNILGDINNLLQKLRVNSKEDSNKANWDKDPFLNAIGIMDSGKEDLSENHDEYLYGKKKTI
ncbi:hypothetical protein MCHI_003459 [Candidatus Magnetoovum chiemensis]|nr:hypothetical protein MCHI_003459 [Candidatus Magnetoovum chiemensis]